MPILSDAVQWIRREFWPGEAPAVVDEAEAQDCIRLVRSGDHCDATLKALERFSELMIQEVQARTQVLDTKALSILGWTAAGAALFLPRAPQAMSLATWQLVLVLVGSVAALGAVMCSFLAMRVRKFSWPSQRDWFRADLLTDPPRLRSYHLLAALETHSSHLLENRRKAYYVHLSQRGLGVTALCITLSQLLGLSRGA